MLNFSARLRSGQNTGRRPQTINHIAIIMDGNGRWAKARGYDRIEGHRAGEQALFEIIDASLDFAVRNLTVFGFSTENWMRDRRETDFIMELIRRLAVDRQQELLAKNVRVRWIGNFSGKLPQTVIEALDTLQNRTARSSALNFTVCVDYGGRQDIVNAVQRCATDVVNHRLAIGDISEKVFERYLAGRLMTVDLLIRTSGEQRLSNFLLWQSARASLVFSSKFWPDFGPSDLADAMNAFAEGKKASSRGGRAK